MTNAEIFEHTEQAIETMQMTIQELYLDWLPSENEEEEEAREWLLDWTTIMLNTLFNFGFEIEAWKF